MDTTSVNALLTAGIQRGHGTMAEDLHSKTEESRADKKKRFHNKSKKGCKTCKIRRVKCDEARPSCQRCVKFGLGCDGYEEDLPRKTKFSHGQVFPNRYARVVPQVQPASTSVCRSPQRPMFKNDQEDRYFKLFSTHTASQLTGLFASNVWDRLVLQVCERNSSVRHAVISLAALDPQTWRSSSSTKSWEESLRRKFAYHEYSLAIIEMKEIMSQMKLDLRTRLVACLVFIAFEIYHRNQKSAVAQIETMSTLIEEQISEQNIYTSSITAIDDELLESFRELEVQNLVNNSHGRKLTTRELLVSRQTIRTKIPQEFVSLRQARSVFHVLVMRQLHWQNTCKHEWPWYATPQTMGLFSLQNDPPPNEYTSAEEWCAERERRFEEYTAWLNAFQPLLLQVRASNDPQELRRANILKMTYLSTYLALMTRMLSPWESWYGQTARLAELMDLIKELIEGCDDTGFSVEMNFLVPLTIVAKMFRHRALRQEAIRLMFAYPRREGLWDGVLVAKSLQWIAEIEEENLGDDEEYVPHDLATDLFGADVDSIKRTAKFMTYQMFRDLPGKMVRRETFIRW